MIFREIRAFNPWPVSYTTLDESTVRVWSARLASEIDHQQPGVVVRHDSDGIFVSCADGVLQIVELQFAGRKRCNTAETLNARNLRGRLLGRS